MKRESQSSLTDFLNSELSKDGASGNPNTKRQSNSGRNSGYSDRRNSQSIHTNAVASKSLQANVNLNFCRPTATVVTHSANLNLIKSDESVPAVCAIEVVPFLPTSESSMSAVNVSASVLYSQFREKITGRKNYEVDDLFYYVFCVNQIHCMYNHLARAVKVANKYSPTNFAIPRLLLKAMGFNPQQFIDELSEWNMYMQVFCNKLNSIAAPDVFPLYKQQRDMFTKIYYDNNATKSQMYIYVPKCLGKYVPNRVQLPSGTNVWTAGISYMDFDFSLYYRGLESEGLTLTTIKEWVDSMFGGLTRMANLGVDYALIAGDTLRVTTRYMKATPCNYSDAAPFTYDVNELQCIQNATSMIIDDIAISEPVPTEANPVREQKLLTRVTVDTEDTVATCRTWLYGKFVNSLKNNPSPSDVCKWIRLSAIADNFNNTTNANHISNTGVVCGEMHLVYYSSKFYDNVDQSTLTDGIIFAYSTMSPNAQLGILRAVDRLTKFDYHPSIRFTYKEGEDLTTNDLLAFNVWDLGIWAELSPSAWRDYVDTYSAALMAL